MEVADKGIEIQSVCPGPVDTPFMREIFGTQINSQTTKLKVSLIITTTAIWGGGGGERDSRNFNTYSYTGVRSIVGFSIGWPGGRERERRGINLHGILLL